MRDVLGAAPAPSSCLRPPDRRAGGGGGGSETSSRTSLLRPLLLLRRSLMLSRRARACTTTPSASARPCPEPQLSRWHSQRTARIAAAAAARDATADADANAPTQLDDQHLARYLAAHCPEGSLVPRSSLTERQERDHVMKSIILSAKSLGPVLAVARLADRVDERAVAAHLGLSRRAIRLATPDEALEWSGFVVGTVPPIGHRVPLRTLVDARVTSAGEGADAAVFGGGGREGVEMRVPLAALLRASCAEVGCFVKADGAGGTTVSTVSSSSSDEEDGGGSSKKAKASAPPPPPLPLPWPAGSDFVRLVATVSSRRRVARLLMFATLAPEEVGAGQQQQMGGRQQGGNNNSNGARPRPWARPGAVAGNEAAVEVQLIVGKTLERALGADALARLLSSVKPGCVVAVTGRVQQQQQQQQQQLGDEAGDGSASSSSSPATTLDVVACELEVLHPSIAERDAALRAAEARAGLQTRSLRSARDLLALRRTEAGDGAYSEFARAFGLPPGDATAAAATTTTTTTEPVAPKSPPAPKNEAEDDDDDDYDDNEPCYRLPFSPEDDGAVVLVDSVAGVEACAAAFRAAELEQRRRWEQENNSKAGADSSSLPPQLSSRFLLSQNAAVVGIDAEWMPFGCNGSNGASSASESDGPAPSSSSSSSRARSPVAMLQLALRDRVFLLDLPALVGGKGKEAGTTPESDQPTPLTPSERAVDALLSHLLASPWLVKCGFGLQHDLRRLADSYPRLHTFAPETAGEAAPSPTPISSHVDLPLLARAVLPSLAYKDPASAPRPLGPVPSLSRLCEAALGLKLDKRQQRSAWERRPLSRAQVRYAAADAHVLTAVFDSLVERAAFLGDRGEDDAGEAARALDGGLRRVPRAKPTTAATTTTTTTQMRRR